MDPSDDTAKTAGKDYTNYGGAGGAGGNDFPPPSGGADLGMASMLGALGPMMMCCACIILGLAIAWMVFVISTLAGTCQYAHAYATHARMVQVRS